MAGLNRPSAKAKVKRKLNMRAGVQLFFFILITIIVINRTLARSDAEIAWISFASLHTLGSFGGVVSAYKYVTTGTFLKWIQEPSFVLMLSVFILSLLFGPVFCGWICPLGTFQEWISGIGKKFFKQKHNGFVSQRIDRYLRFIRYAVLFVILYMTAKWGYFKFADIDPYYALFHFWNGEAATGGIAVLLLVAGAALLVQRPWCKYLCPYGALLGLFNLFRIFKIRREPAKCISCGACDRVCPMNIPVSKGEVIRHHQCIVCLKCTSENACPVAETVELTSKTRIAIDRHHEKEDVCRER